MNKPTNTDCSANVFPQREVSSQGKGENVGKKTFTANQLCEFKTFCDM